MKLNKITVELSNGHVYTATATEITLTESMTRPHLLGPYTPLSIACDEVTIHAHGVQSRGYQVPAPIAVTVPTKAKRRAPTKRRSGR